MSQPFVAEIMMFGGNFAPRGWALCNGQLLPISQNTALFSLLGTTYGGDGRTTFGLPNLQARVPINAGQGPGLSNRVLGETGGAESVSFSTVATASAPVDPIEAMTIAGGSQSVPTVSPFLALTFVIALQGIYPARN